LKYKHPRIYKSISRCSRKNKRDCNGRDIVYQLILKVLDFKLKIAFRNKLLRNDMGWKYMYITLIVCSGCSNSRSSWTIMRVVKCDFFFWREGKRKEKNFPCVKNRENPRCVVWVGERGYEGERNERADWNQLQSGVIYSVGVWRVLQRNVTDRNVINDTRTMTMTTSTTVGGGNNRY